MRLFFFEKRFCKIYLHIFFSNYNFLRDVYLSERFDVIICIFSGLIIAQFTIPDSNGNIDPEAPPSNYGRRRSRAVLYQLSGHYKQDNKHKIKLNNVRLYFLLKIITIFYKKNNLKLQ